MDPRPGPKPGRIARGFSKRIGDGARSSSKPNRDESSEKGMVMEEHAKLIVRGLFTFSIVWSISRYRR